MIKKMFLSEQPSLREVSLCVSSWNKVMLPVIGR